MILRQTATIPAIAEGGENGTRQEMRNWLVVSIVRVTLPARQGHPDAQGSHNLIFLKISRMISELSTNGKNLVDFGIRALPVAHHANQFMPAAWNEMDDVMDIKVG